MMIMRCDYANKALYKEIEGNAERFDDFYERLR